MSKEKVTLLWASADQESGTCQLWKGKIKPKANECGIFWSRDNPRNSYIDGEEIINKFLESAIAPGTAVRVRLTLTKDKVALERVRRKRKG